REELRLHDRLAGGRAAPRSRAERDRARDAEERDEHEQRRRQPEAEAPWSEAPVGSSEHRVGGARGRRRYRPAAVRGLRTSCVTTSSGPARGAWPAAGGSALHRRSESRSPPAILLPAHAALAGCDREGPARRGGARARRDREAAGR